MYMTSSDEQHEEHDIDNVDITSVGEVLTDDTAVDLDVYLPHQGTCFSYSLNLLATVDARKACESDGAYKRLYRAAIGKCTSIWNATHRSSKGSRCSQRDNRSDNVTVITPGTSCWNSHFDVVKRILEMGTKLGDVCQAIGVPKLKPSEIVS